MNVSSIALSGLEAAQQSLEKTARQVAQMPTDGGGDVVDLTAAAVAMMSARNLTQVNLKVLETADQMAKSTLDTLL